MVCKIIFCSEFPDTPAKTEKKRSRRRRRTPAIAKRYAFHANAKNKCVSNVFIGLMLANSGNHDSPI